MLKKFKNLRYALAGVLLLFCAAVQAQTISGNVKDSNGEPIIGATIMEQGTQNGTVTDFDGNFTLKLQKAGDLNISYIGMKSQVVKTAGKSSVAITLEDDNTTLNDVVVVGYGTMKRKDLTGSVSSVTGDNLAKVPVANVADALQGKLSGVNVTAQDGRPGGSSSIRVRGGGSITQSNDPLFIVDGIAVSTIDDIPADNIESIDVLKDAASTAIYGARGANGVILVTTKSAKEGKATVKYNMYYQLKAKPTTLTIQNAYDHVMTDWMIAKGVGDATAMEQYYGLGSSYGNHLNEYNNVASHNYMDDVFSSGSMWNHDLSLSGGTEKTKYYADVNYVNDGATFKNSGYSRWSINMKLQQKIAKNLTLDLNARYSESKTDNNKYMGSLANNAITYPWNFNNVDTPLGDGDPTHFTMSNQFVEDDYNPLNVLNDYTNTQKKNRMGLNSSLTWQIIKGLTAKTELYVARNWNNTQQYDGGNTGGISKNAQWTKSDGYNVHWTNTINYDFSDVIKSDKHSLNVLLGHEMLSSKSETTKMVGYGFPQEWDAEQCFGNFALADKTNANSVYSSSIGTPSKTLSFFGRVNYNLLSRYLFTFTMRADGSSKFSADNRWGYFPAGAIAWRISDEPFMEKTKDWLDNLKLRISYGLSGNDGIDASMFKTLWKAGTDKNGNSIYKVTDALGNPDLKWETTISRNLGLDYSFLNGKFNGSLDLYWNTTKDCLMQVPFDSSTGFSYQMQNIAQTSNKGVEFAFNYNIINKKDFSLEFGITYNYNFNNVDKLLPGIDASAKIGYASTAITPTKPYYVEEGSPVGLVRGFQSLGYYTASDFHMENGKWKLNDGVLDTNLDGITSYNIPAEYKGMIADGQTAFPGMQKYADANGDGKVDINDITNIAEIQAHHTGGFHFAGHYKNLDFSANFTYQLDGHVFNGNLAKSMFGGGATKGLGMSRLAEVNDCWKMYEVGSDGNLNVVTDLDALASLNANTKYGANIYAETSVVTSDYIESASYLRLQTLTVGYTFPKPWINKIGLSNARVYVTAGNLFCIAGYSGLDPDVNVDSSADSDYSGFPTLGYDYQAYPKSRTFTFGLNVAF